MAPDHGVGPPPAEGGSGNRHPTRPKGWPQDRRSRWGGDTQRHPVAESGICPDCSPAQGHSPSGTRVWGPLPRPHGLRLLGPGHTPSLGPPGHAAELGVRLPSAPPLRPLGCRGPSAMGARPVCSCPPAPALEPHLCSPRPGRTNALVHLRGEQRALTRRRRTGTGSGCRAGAWRSHAGGAVSGCVAEAPPGPCQQREPVLPPGGEPRCPVNSGRGGGRSAAGPLLRLSVTEGPRGSSWTLPPRSRTEIRVPSSSGCNALEMRVFEKGIMLREVTAVLTKGEDLALTRELNG